MARAMKDSGVAWIGEIPERWKIGKASLFFDIQLGKMLQPETSSDEDTYEYYLCAANLGGNELKMNPLRQMWFSANDKAQFAVKKGDLLVVEGGDVASCDIIREEVHDLYIQNALHRVRSKNGFSVEYLRYLLMIAKARGHIDLICNKATIAHFTKDKFGSLPFIVSSVAEQSRIAAFLDRQCGEIIRVIEQTRASIEEYKKLKQAVITQAVTKGIRPDRPMKDSGVEWIGEIPYDWRIIKLKAIINTIESGVSVNAGQLPAENGAIGVLKTSCVSRFVFQPFENKEVNSNEISRVSCPVKKNTIIMSRMNTPDLVGACGYVESDYPNLYLPDRLWQITFVAQTNVKYLWYYLNSRQVRNYYASLAVGTSNSMQNISQDQFYHTYSILPSIEEQDEIVIYLDNKISRIDQLIVEKEHLLTELESYKKSLIYEYVTGKKEVPA